MIRFVFNLEKAVAAMAYILDRLGPMDKVKLMKLIYLADREHLLVHDRPITGGRLVAMDHGPLPSECLSVINGDYATDRGDVYDTFHLVDHTVSLKRPVATDVLDDLERSTLDGVIETFGQLGTWVLRDKTHRLPEYAAFYQERTSRTIPVESLMRLAGSDRVDDRGRVTVSSAMAGAMLNPFSADDSDL